ncbi:hypothetical protein N492_10075 [Clostridium botulinum B2 267]|uniref:hypothetical protein n=1 Tax=Clostridium botulinum TaxID=1491 RepID=UPI0007E0AB4D|nr:hypothetical protein [Clostridium botulinum]KEI87335.1 hypothetical protein N492_10075 [Clostridium botulinum B2 267]
MTVDKTLEKALAKHFVYDSWQFVMNTQKTIVIAHYCTNIIKKSIEEIVLGHTNWKNEIFGKSFIESNKEQHISITYETLPGYEINIMGIETSYSFLLDKMIKDFFQYARNSFDCMAQIANSALLGNKSKARNSVDFPRMLSTFNQQSYSKDFPNIQKWFTEINENPLFQYLDDFNNRTKHTCDVSLNLAISLISNYKTTNINKFYKKSQQLDKDILSIVSDIYSFIETSFKDLLLLIKQEIQREIYIADRYHQLSCYQQKMKNNENNDLSVVYIESKDCNKLPDELRILLLNDSNDEIMAKNCEIKNIFIRNLNGEYIEQYVIADNSSKEDVLVEYVKYIRVKKTPFLGIVEVCEAFEKDRQFYHSNPYIKIETKSDDNEFLQRVQSPF